MLLFLVSPSFTIAPLSFTHLLPSPFPSLPFPVSLSCSPPFLSLPFPPPFPSQITATGSAERHSSSTGSGRSAATNCIYGAIQGQNARGCRYSLPAAKFQSRYHGDFILRMLSFRNAEKSCLLTTYLLLVSRFTVPRFRPKETTVHRVASVISNESISE